MYNSSTPFFPKSLKTNMLDEYSPPQEAFRVTKVGSDRVRIDESPLDQPNRRSLGDRFATRKPDY